MRRLGVRWTIGDVSPAGFEALRLSVQGAVRLFGATARYCVCVNNMSVAAAQRRAGPMPRDVAWRSADPSVPDLLQPFLSTGMAEGVAWKLSPLRLFRHCHELSLDNDVVLWDVPRALYDWLNGPDPTACLIAEDVTPAFGQFGAMCGAAPRNSGIRGLGPRFDLGAALARVLERAPVRLHSELDEQGLQIAALSADNPAFVIPVDDVTICSPFYPHRPGLGRCGAHFVGLNARDIPWRYYDQPATSVRIRHWKKLRPEVHRRVGLPLPACNSSENDPLGGAALGPVASHRRRTDRDTGAAETEDTGWGL
jgi:hypothetical protein